MPGLSQLKQFNKDIQSLGDEITLRATRGEKPIVVPIPKGITVEDDSEDFVLGMPDNPRVVDNSNVDDDLSEITGITSGKAGSSSGEEAAPSFEAPDMSSLLAPVDLGSDAGGDDGMPDLSQFMDEPVEEEPEVIEEEPEEISVADMGLEALLAGAGFDGTEGTEEEQEEIAEPEPEEDLNSATSLPVDDGMSDLGAEAPSAADDFDFSTGAADLPDFDLPDAGSVPEAEPFPTEDFNMPEIGDIPEAPEVPEMPDVPEAPEAAETFDVPEMAEIPEAPEAAEPAEELGDLDEIGELGDVEDLGDTEDFGTTEDLGTTEDFDMPEPADIPEVPEVPEEVETDSKEKASDLGELGDLDELGNIDDLGDVEDLGDTTEAAEPSTADLFNAQDVEIPDFDNAAAGSEETFEMDSDASLGADTDFDAGTDTDFDTGADFGSETDSDFDASTDFGDFDSADEGSLDEGGAEEAQSEPIETFDVSQMEDIDFGIQDTDTQLSVDTGSDDFELESGKVSMEGSDFEIPGFSDVEAAPAVPNTKKSKGLDVPDFNGALPGKDLPPNTLSDEQYKQFLKNLNEYPLNVRLAFEDLIVQDEFTDDAEFEIIEKILKKAPARQVASTLEKMLDTSIPVPRDFEHRTAEEYEAYKKSLSYQLRNKVLPGLLCTILLLFVGWGLFNFTKNCIVIPAQASSLYKQGYALLEADEYVQSQIKFDEAAAKQLRKKWFFRYARGYRAHKQYLRAADIYGKILIYFNHDKTAGLEYAQMELDDLANYERAEEITRREILDYHINDADGILMLGDIFLEWGTEKDPQKLDLAKEQYMQLIQLYKPNDLYNSRLMRYYIRSDNLQQVLSYKRMFEEEKKPDVSAQDWTELGGYLLSKLYGNIAPSEEYLRYQIEGLLKLLIKATDMDDSNPIAWYNLGNYYVYTNDSIDNISYSLKKALERFNKAEQLKKRDIYKYIDTYRLLGENYLLTNEYLQAQEQFTQGITLYTTEKENAGFEGNEQIGLMYADLGNINYTVAGDYDTAAMNYKNAVALGYDVPYIRYRLGYISYKAKNYLEALGSFMKAGEANKKERNLLLAMANTLSLRNDDYAAEGYYEQLINMLDNEIVDKGGTVFPQTDDAGYDLVTTYLYAANNYGVTLYRLAKRTGDSQKNAQAIVQMQQSVRAWDSLTRDQQTLIRLDGSNLAQENIKYITHPVSEFEPAIYIEIPKNLTENEGL